MKKSRLLEIIREEISGALKEVGQSPEAINATKKAIEAKKAQILAAQKELQQLQKSGISEVALEEDTLNEAPIYSVEDMAGFQSTLDTFREKGVSKSKALNILLQKLEDEGTVDTNALSKEYGVDSATFNNQEIRKFLNRPEGEAFTDKKTGDELIDFTPLLSKADKPRGRKVDLNKPKEEPKEPGIRGRKPAEDKPKTPIKDTSAEDKSTEDKGIEQKSRKDDEIIKQYRDVMSAYKKMKTEKGDQAATAYLKTKQNIVKKYKEIQQGKL
jgi:hypothetical protein